MRYVIIRDDDTNALTPIAYLERLYRPFLDKGFPVNLATIPNVRTEITYGKGIPEGFLVAKNGTKEPFVPIGANRKLVEYLLANPGYKIVQHGYCHEFVNGSCEFEQTDSADIAMRLDRGSRFLQDAGFAKPNAFVAPYDRLTRVSYQEVSERFKVISANWFEVERLPVAWWPWYAVKKVSGKPHWRTPKNILLSHPGCHLSYHRPYDTMLETIRKSIESRRLTVLVTHWWEFFRDNYPDDAFIDVLHATADYLARADDIKVISFEDVAAGEVALS